MEDPQKLKTELPYDSAIPLLGIYPKETKTLTRKVVCTSMFIAALVTIAKTWKQPKCPSMDKWIKKMGYIYTHTHIHICLCMCIYIHNWYKWTQLIHIYVSQLYPFMYIKINIYMDFLIFYGLIISHFIYTYIPFVTTWMDLEGIMLSEISQTEKDKYLYDLTYMWSQKTNKKTNS